MSRLYNYRAKVRQVIDGQSYVMNINLGMGVALNGVFVRCAGIHCPEKGEPGFEESANYAKDILHGKTVFIHTIKKNSLGKWTCTIWTDIKDWPVEFNFGDQMVGAGHAVYDNMKKGK